jgi:hypothetical protein
MGESHAIQGVKSASGKPRFRILGRMTGKPEVIKPLKKESNRRQNGAFQQLSRDGTRKRLICQLPAGAV